MNNYSDQVSLIWQVADLLRGDYKQSDYGKVIFPVTVLRRLDCEFAPAKKKVLDYLPKVKSLSDKREYSNHRSYSLREIISVLRAWKQRLCPGI